MGWDGHSIFELTKFLMNLICRSVKKTNVRGTKLILHRNVKMNDIKNKNEQTWINHSFYTERTNLFNLRTH